jgi:hypothetical protein
MKHDKIIDDIIDRLYPTHCKDNLESCKKYELNHRMKPLEGECDFYLINNKYAYAVEVKTTDSKKHRKKAIEQLNKDIQYLRQYHDCERIFCFYAYSTKQGYNVELIKKFENGQEKKYR